MFSQGSQLLSSFLCFFVLHQAATRIECEPGQMASLDGDKCVPCPKAQYQPDRGDYVECLNCMPCRNSREVSPCTPYSNTKCECWVGFSFLRGSNAECRCQKGSGTEMSEKGELICKKCPIGTFTSGYNSKCQPWKKCDHDGVMVAGTDTSDVICKKFEKRPEISTLTPSAILEPQTSANTSPMAPTRIQTTKTSVYSSAAPSSAPPSTRQMPLHHWMVPLGCVLALLLIQLAIIKLKVTTCFGNNKKGMHRQDSKCGKPVEESGEKFIPPAV
ncbi:tumor necrosis factor receptor superfamily member 1B [Salminus brasiliensis]|uniref:tumor necrosis factor receptor superfamily member 1B n=1 Tax=Salminus brasiliensis TaxID=930266 RepID=UPI003B831332